MGDETMENQKFESLLKDGIEREENGNVMNPVEPSDWKIAE